MSAARRLPLLLPAGAALLAGLLAGLARLGWTLPPPAAAAAAHHGGLMVSGFLGTLIALERAVALGRPWGYAAPGLAGAGALALLLGAPGAAAGLALAASAALCCIFAAILRREPAVHHGVMAAGALSWAAGNALWAAQGHALGATGAWMAFLVLTVAGERLELSRLGAASPRAARSLLLAAALTLCGAALAPFSPPGTHILGAGLLGVALWLLRFDLAWRTLRGNGLARYAATALLSGYGWLAAGGALLLAAGPATGPLRDAQIHAIFVGFVLSMIFGHAPIVLPAVLGRPLAYRPALYAPLALLHAALALRVLGDLASATDARRWGGLLGALAVLGFAALMARSAARRQPRRP